MHSCILTVDISSFLKKLAVQSQHIDRILFINAKEDPLLSVVCKVIMLVVGGFLVVTAVSLLPVQLSLHLHESGDGPLKGKDFLLGCE